MKDWIYKSPLKMGYIRIKLSKAQHKAIFKVRKIRLWDSAAYFYNGENVIVEHFCAWWFVALVAIPHFLIGPLLIGIPKTFREFNRQAFPRHYGSFTEDRWRLALGEQSADEQPIVDAWLRHMSAQYPKKN